MLHKPLMSCKCHFFKFTSLFPFHVTQKATFAATAVSGLFLILAPEEPSLSLGGGDLYALVPGIVLLVVAIVTIPLGVFGCLSVRYDSSKRLIIVRYNVIAS